MKRVVVTGMGGVTALGSEWSEIQSAIEQGRNAVRRMPEWDYFDTLHARRTPRPGPSSASSCAGTPPVQ